MGKRNKYGDLPGDSEAEYDKRQAEATGLSSKAKVTMLDGPAKGEKRKISYDAATRVSAIPVAKRRATSLEEPAAPAALAAQASTAAAPAATRSAEAATAPSAWLFATWLSVCVPLSPRPPSRLSTHKDAQRVHSSVA